MLTHSQVIPEYLFSYFHVTVSIIYKENSVLKILCVTIFAFLQTSDTKFRKLQEIFRTEQNNFQQTISWITKGFSVSFVDTLSNLKDQENIFISFFLPWLLQLPTLNCHRASLSYHKIKYLIQFLYPYITRGQALYSFNQHLLNTYYELSQQFSKPGLGTLGGLPKILSGSP